MAQRQVNKKEAQMKRGQYIEHPTRPEWGTGEVVDVSDNKVSVKFQHVGLKTLDIRAVTLRLVEHGEPVPIRIDLERLEILCNRFHADQEHNRRGFDDGNMATLVLADVKRRGLPTEAHKKRLLDWCYTDGNPFQSGVSLAREICTAIYGRVLPDPDATRRSS